MAEMSDPEIIEKLVEIREAVKDVNGELKEIKQLLLAQQTWIWRILMLTIAGSFALIGVKLYLPA